MSEKTGLQPDGWFYRSPDSRFLFQKREDGEWWHISEVWDHRARKWLSRIRGAFHDDIDVILWQALTAKEQR